MARERDHEDHRSTNRECTHTTMHRRRHPTHPRDREGKHSKKVPKCHLSAGIAPYFSAHGMYFQVSSSKTLGLRRSGLILALAPGIERTRKTPIISRKAHLKSWERDAFGVVQKCERKSGIGCRTLGTTIDQLIRTVSRH